MEPIKGVSIHATLAGGDWRPEFEKTLFRSFYPRHPRGWRPPYIVVKGAGMNVSIHATLAGGDYSATCRVSSSLLFLSTPPSRVATPSGMHIMIFQPFLSTPPSRVATSVSCVR